MGQRHQVYLRVPEIFYNQNNPNNKPSETVGIHHQWLYGITALKLLRNFLIFMKNTSDATLKVREPLEILRASYTFDPSLGYFHNVTPLIGVETKDPRKGDNNNGITVIDLFHDKPKYAFLSLYGLECEMSKGFTVRHPNDPDKNQDISYNNFVPIGAEEWIKLHYGPKWKENLINSGEGDELNNIMLWIKTVQEYELLTVDELAAIFPQMVSEAQGEGLYLTPNTIKFIMDDDKISLKATSKTKRKVKKKLAKN